MKKFYFFHTCFLFLISNFIYSQNYRIINYSNKFYNIETSEIQDQNKVVFKYENPAILFDQYSELLESSLDLGSGQVVPRILSKYYYENSNPPRQKQVDYYKYNGGVLNPIVDKRSINNYVQDGEFLSNESLTIIESTLGFDTINKSIIITDMLDRQVGFELYLKNSNNVFNKYFESKYSYTGTRTEFDTLEQIYYDDNVVVNHTRIIRKYDNLNRNIESYTYKIDPTTNVNTLESYFLREYSDEKNHTQKEFSGVPIILTRLLYYTENEDMVEIVTNNVLNNDIAQLKLLSKQILVKYKPTMFFSKYTTYGVKDSGLVVWYEVEFEYEKVSKSIDYNKNDKVKLLNNVCRNSIEVISNEEDKNAAYFIISSNGSIVEKDYLPSTNFNTIDISNFAPGQYFVIFPTLNSRALPFVKL